MNFEEEISLLIKSRYPLVMVDTIDEEYVLDQLYGVAQAQGLNFYSWSLSKGLRVGKNENSFYKSNEAAAMLRELSGTGHTVFSGVTVIKGESADTRVEQTEVYFRVLSEREIQSYIDTGEPMDKAGAYGAQGLASLFVEGIDGDFFNVMGLPVCTLGKMLREQGVELI